MSRQGKHYAYASMVRKVVRQTVDSSTELRFRFAPGESVSIDDLGRLAKDVNQLVKDVAQTVTGRTTSWIVTDLSLGSVNLAVAPTGLKNEAVVNAVFYGLQLIEERAERPPHFSERALRLVGSLARLSYKKGLEIEAGGKKMCVTKLASSHVSEMLATKRHHLGSIIGHLDVVSVHNGLRVTVYGQQGEVVPCSLSEGMLNRVKDLLGQRVLITGILSVNAAGNPLRMDAEDIFVMTDVDAVKPILTLYRSVPDLTGGLNVTEYLSEAWCEV